MVSPAREKCDVEVVQSVIGDCLELDGGDIIAIGRRSRKTVSPCPERHPSHVSPLLHGTPSRGAGRAMITGSSARLTGWDAPSRLLIDQLLFRKLAD
jgi:hypothetical protein